LEDLFTGRLKYNISSMILMPKYGTTENITTDTSCSLQAF